MHPHVVETPAEGRPKSTTDWQAVDPYLGMAGWFNKPGAYVLVDGQFGSTGKGLMASVLARMGAGYITHVTTNAGPNSGHTAYIDGVKVMTQQVPIAGVALAKWGFGPEISLNAGAIIDPEILLSEVKEHQLQDVLTVHPTAAVIGPAHRAQEASNPDILRIASTGKGTGAAIASKVLRENNTAGVRHLDLPDIEIYVPHWDWTRNRVLVETAQGFSLGINEPRFHPFTTSRECTVMQAVADARIPVGRVRNVCACYRTFPIRVGNTVHGKSGDHYPDQEELLWQALGIAPELTSVTGRVRRVFTWSRLQFKESIAANEPDTLFINFMNYIREEAGRRKFIGTVLDDYRATLGRSPLAVLVGYGPKPEDVFVW